MLTQALINRLFPVTTDLAAQEVPAANYAEAYNKFHTSNQWGR